MTPWWLGLGPAQATVTCGEHSHRLRWSNGALHAVDHDDPEAERALAALGGQRCACVEVLDAWTRHEADPRVLVLASRGAADPVAAEASWTAQLAGRRGTLATAPPIAGSMSGGWVGRPRVTPAQLLRRPSRRRSAAKAKVTGGASMANISQTLAPIGQIPLRSEPESELVALLGLGGGLPDRLVAGVAAAWARRFEEPGPELSEARASLRASMEGRLWTSVRGWLGRIDVPIALDLIEDRRAPSIGDHEGTIRAALPFDWLAEVWSRGLAVVFGRFCLAASTEDGLAWTLTTVGPDFGPPAPVRVELPAAS